MPKGKVLWPIPDDWNEAEDGYVCVLFCAPNSRTWRGIVAGQIDDFSYGRHWDRKTGTITSAQAIARDIFESMCMVNCEDLVNAAVQIAASVTLMAEKVELFAQASMADLDDGDVLFGPGQEFPDSASYFDAKCNAANAIFDTIRSGIDWLENNDVDLLLGAYGGITTGLALALVLAGPVGWAITVAEVVLAGIAALLIASAFNFTDLRDALDDTHDACVLSLYNADDAETGRVNFIAALAASSVPTSPVERELIEFMLSADALNQLFDPRSDVANYESPSPVDCGGSILQVWSFPADVESWTFVDQSTKANTAAAAWNSDEESIRQTIVMSGETNSTGRGENTSPAVAIAIVPGSSIQVDHNGTSDAPTTQTVEVKCIYDDATFEETSKVGSGPTTVTLTLTQNKTIEFVEVTFKRSWTGTARPTNHTSDMLEVRVVGL